jgi:D-proline reductase (dithiol) PrdB
MNDSEGDPTFRVIDGERPRESLMITHDYYDHKDADRDVNIVLPLDRLREMEDEKILGRLLRYHYSFMGHIDGRHISTLVEGTGPEVARRLKKDGADVVLLTPG